MLLLSLAVNILAVNTSSPSLTNTSIDDVSTKTCSFKLLPSYGHFLSVPYSVAKLSPELLLSKTNLFSSKS